MFGDDLINPDAYLMISGIQHYCFCPRQWALIHIEQQWEDNWRTVSGQLVHKRVHDEGVYEGHKNSFVLRGLRVSSSRLGLSGICDAVEFIRDEKGVAIKGHDGLWTIIPVEYKRGKERKDEADHFQLCAQVFALEEMFSASITYGFIYHNETRRRERVEIDNAIREKTVKMAEEMSYLYLNGITPTAEKSIHCLSCSLVNICLPRVNGSDSFEFIKSMMKE